MDETLQPHSGPNWLIQRQTASASAALVQKAVIAQGLVEPQQFPDRQCQGDSSLCSSEGPALTMSPPPWAWLQGSEGQLLL